DAQAALVIEDFGVDQVARHPGDALAGELAALKAEITEGVGHAVVEARPFARRAQHAAQAQLDPLVPRAAAIVVGPGRRAVGVAHGNQLVLDVAVIEGQRPAWRIAPAAEQAVATDLDRIGALQLELAEPCRAHGIVHRIGQAHGTRAAVDDFPVGRRLVAAADVDIEALVVRRAPDQAELRADIIPVLIQRVARHPLAGVADGLREFHVADHRPARLYVPGGTDHGVAVFRLEVIVAVVGLVRASV